MILTENRIKQNLLVFIFSFLLLLFLNEIIINHKVSHRQVHNDEIYEFVMVLLNNAQVDIDSNYQVNNAKLYADTFYLTKENRFAYKKLLEHPILVGDTHPYMHYLALHTIYSAFSYINDGAFTPYALESLSAIFNAILMALSAVLLLAIFRKIYKEPNFNLIAITIFAYLVLPVSTYLTPYARMYCLYIFSSVLYVYLLISTIERATLLKYFAITLTVFLGFSTHYYFLLVVGSFLGVYFIFNFLFKNYDKKLFPFLNILFFSMVGFSLVFWFFPATSWHLTSGHRAEQAISLITSYWYIWAILVAAGLFFLYKLWQTKPLDFVSFYNAKIGTDILTKNANIVFFGALAFYLMIMLLSPMKIMSYYAPAIPFFFIWAGISIYHSKYMPILRKNQRKIVGWFGAILLIYYSSQFILEQVYHKTFTYRGTLSENVVILQPLKAGDFTFAWQDVSSFTLLDLYDKEILAKICAKEITLPTKFSLIDTYALSSSDGNKRKPKPLAEFFDCLKEQGYSIGDKKKFSRDSDYYEVEIPSSELINEK